MGQLGATLKRPGEMEARRIAHHSDFEFLCEKYGREFAKRLKEHFGAVIFGKEVAKLTPSELAELRPKLARSADYKRILTEVSTEFANALKGPRGVANLSKGFKSADAVARIILYSERTMLKNVVVSDKFESKWRKIVPEIRRTMEERMHELNAERERMLRLKEKFPGPIPVKSGGKPVYRGNKPVVRTVPEVPVELKNKIAKYSMLIKNDEKFMQLLRKSFIEANSLREFFEKVFYFDPHHVGILAEQGRYMKQLVPRSAVNAIDRGINRMIGGFPLVGELTIEMKFLPKALFKQKGKEVLQRMFASKVTERIIEARGGAASIMKTTEELSASTARGVSARKGVASAIKTTQNIVTKDVLKKLEARGINIRGVGAAMAIFAAFSLVYLSGSMESKTTPKSVPKKVN